MTANLMRKTLGFAIVTWSFIPALAQVEVSPDHFDEPAKISRPARAQGDIHSKIREQQKLLKSYNGPLVAASLSFAQSATAGKPRGRKGASNNSSTRDHEGGSSNNSSTREPKGETSNKSSNSSTRDHKGETSNKSSSREHQGGKKGKKAGSDTAKGWNQKPNTRK